jgi:hypothetical protein
MRILADTILTDTGRAPRPPVKRVPFYQRPPRDSFSPEQYARMLIQQNGVCAVCQAPPTVERPRLCIDHNHRTGAVRGLLCNDCNSALGFMREDPDAIMRLAHYASAFSAGRPENPITLQTLLRQKHVRHVMAQATRTMQRVRRHKAALGVVSGRSTE